MKQKVFLSRIAIGILLFSLILGTFSQSETYVGATSYTNAKEFYDSVAGAKKVEAVQKTVCGDFYPK